MHSFFLHEQDMIMTANVIYCTFLQYIKNQTFLQQERISILHIVFLTRLKIKKENRLENKRCRKGWGEVHKESYM
jgi:hypothetical protein